MCKPNSTSRVLRGIVCVVVAALILTTPAYRAVAREDAVVGPAQSLNAAWQRVADARLQLQRWRLERLELLHRRGCASWLEVARQRAAVQRLSAGRQSRETFAAFLSELGSRIRHLPESDVVERPLVASRAMRIFLPGSVRTVGWIVPRNDGMAGQTASRTASQAEAEADATAANHAVDGAAGPADSGADDELQRARERQSQAAERVRGLAAFTGKSDVAEQLRKARLELAVADAEVALQQQWRRLQNDMPSPLVAVSAQPLASADPSYVSAYADLRSGSSLADSSMTVERSGRLERLIGAQGSAELRAATLRVAAAEAGSNAALQAARILVQRRRLRLTACEKLREQGLASTAEMNSARDAVQQAESRVRSLRSTQATLLRSYQDLKREADAVPPRDNTIPGDQPHDRLASADVVGCGAALPACFLTYDAGVRHLIDLRRQSCESTALRGSLLAELQLAEGLVERLEEAGTGGLSRQRELAAARLDAAYFRAAAAAATERMDVLRQEETRFVRQIAEQLQPGEGDPRAPVAYVESSSWNLVGMASNPWSTTFGRPPASDLTRWSVWRPELWRRRVAPEPARWCTFRTPVRCTYPRLRYFSSPFDLRYRACWSPSFSLAQRWRVWSYDQVRALCHRQWAYRPAYVGPGVTAVDALIYGGW